MTVDSASWCTAGFPWKYNGKWYMVTAGHCTSGNGAITNPDGSDYIGPVVRDNWKNGHGSVKLSGQRYYSGDLALYRINSDSSASARIYKGGQDVPFVPARPGLLAALGARGRQGLHGWNDDRREVRLGSDRHPGDLRLLRRYDGQEHGRRQEDVRILHDQG